MNHSFLAEQWPSHHQRKESLPLVSFLFSGSRHNSLCILSKPPS